MRIVGGEFKGKALTAPKSDNIRPTTDRARESLFNIITHNYDVLNEDTRMLDLFAGTGALGIEALSRGVGFVLFVENSVEGRGLLRQNTTAFSLQGRSKIYRRDATNLGDLGGMQPFSFVFADPPYGKGLGEKAAKSMLDHGWLSENALFILEEKKSAAPETLEGFERLDARNVGDSQICFFQRK